MKKRNKIVLLIVAILIIVILSFIAINYQSKELRDILKSPMANLQLNTGEEVDSYYNDRGTSLGKLSYVTLRTSYQSKADHLNAELFDEIIKSIKDVVNNSDEIVFDEKTDRDRVVEFKDIKYYRTSFLYKKHLVVLVDVHEHSDKDNVSVKVTVRNSYPEIDLLMMTKDALTL